MSSATVDVDLAGRATADAAHAAARAGVTTTELHALADLHDVVDLFSLIWGDQRSAPVAPDLMGAFSHAGGYVAGARRGGRLVAASVGFLARTASGTGLHSHVTCVHPEAQGASVGYAVKLHQRAWALERGMRHITWTFDPLLRRNAWFNVSKLGAVAGEYVEDFYGSMGDPVNGDGPSDRLIASWDLLHDARRAEAVATGGATVALSVGADGGPVPGRLAAGTLLCALPADIVSLRRHDPALAADWRRAVREVLGAALDGSRRVVAVTTDGHYVVAADTSGGGAP